MWIILRYIEVHNGNESEEKEREENWKRGT